MECRCAGGGRWPGLPSGSADGRRRPPPTRPPTAGWRRDECNRVQRQARQSACPSARNQSRDIGISEIEVSTRRQNVVIGSKSGRLGHLVLVGRRHAARPPIEARNWPLRTGSYRAPAGGPGRRQHGSAGRQVARPPCPALPSPGLASPGLACCVSFRICILPARGNWGTMD